MIIKKLPNKVVWNGETLIDLTEDTVNESVLRAGYTAHDASGFPIIGTYDPTLQEKTIRLDSNGTTEITPDDGYIGLSKVTISNYATKRAAGSVSVTIDRSAATSFVCGTVSFAYIWACGWEFKGKNIAASAVYTKRNTHVIGAKPTVFLVRGYKVNASSQKYDTSATGITVSDGTITGSMTRALITSNETVTVTWWAVGQG